MSGDFSISAKMSKRALGCSLAAQCLVLLMSEQFTRASATTNDTNEKLNTIDSLLRHALEKISIVGLSVGIVKDGQTVFAKGYGLRNHTDPSSHVTNRTTFRIGSVTKAFTTYAIDRLLNDDGIIDWDDLIIKHIPEFRMSNDHTWTHATVRDLCSHATGLPPHEMVWLYGNFSRAELLERIPHLQTNFELRARYQYNNMMFAVIGLLIERATGGKKWEAVISERIIKPFNLNRTFTTLEEMWKAGADDVAVPHGVPKGADPSAIAIVPVVKLIHLAPAGDMWSSAEDLASWIQVQLNLSRKSKEMHVPQINVPADSTTGQYFGYGLGWRTAYHRGRSYIWHTGGIDGFRAHLALFPEENIGIVVLANLDTLLDFNAHLLLKIADILMNHTFTEEDVKKWVTNEVKLLAESQASTKWRDMKLMEADVSVLSQPEQFVGTYENGGYGVVQVSVDKSRLVAVLNSVHYTLVPTKTPDYFSAQAPFPREFRFDFWFVRDPWGEIIGFRFDLEPIVSPIYFEKQVADDLHAIEYLQPFAGTYGKINFSINRREGVLVASGDSLQRYVGKFRPIRRNMFKLKNYYCEFVVGGEVVTQLNIYEGEQITTFPKK